MGAAAIGGLLLGDQVRRQEEQHQTARRQLQMQEKVQAQQLGATIRQARQADIAQNMANQKKPDIAAILATAAGSLKPNTSALGDPAKLRLGKTTLLG